MQCETASTSAPPACRLSHNRACPKLAPRPPPRYARAFVFRYENMRNQTLKELRDELQGHTRFFLGSNKARAHARGSPSRSASALPFSRLLNGPAAQPACSTAPTPPQSAARSLKVLQVALGRSPEDAFRPRLNEARALPSPAPPARHHPPPTTHHPCCLAPTPPTPPPRA